MRKRAISERVPVPRAGHPARKLYIQYCWLLLSGPAAALHREALIRGFLGSVLSGFS